MELITSSQVYWLTRLDYIQGFFIACAAIGGFATIISALIVLLNKNNEYNQAEYKLGRFFFRLFCPIFIIGLLAVFFIPSTKEAMAIWGLPKIVNSPQIQQLGQNSLTVVEGGLQYVHDILKEKENK